MTTAKELGLELEAKRKKLHEIFSEIKKEGANEERSKSFDELNAEVRDLGAKYDKLRDIEAAAAENDVALKGMNAPANIGNLDLGGKASAGQKSLGEMIFENAALKARLQTVGTGGTVAAHFDGVDVKTLMTTLAGFPPESTRNGRIVDLVQQRPVIADLISQTNTTMDTVKWIEETMYTNNATATAEGAAAPESALQFVERSAPVQKIATHIPVTEEQLADVPFIQTLVNERLLLMLRQSEDNYLLNGTGVSPQIKGLLNVAGLGNYAAVVGESISDAIYKGHAAVLNANGTAAYAATTTGVIIHPTTWAQIRLEKGADGHYIYGNPNQAQPDTIWGLPVVQSTYVPVKTIVVGDFKMYAQIARRTGITIEVGYINDQFIAGQQTIKVTERLAHLVYRANAFCRITLP